MPASKVGLTTSVASRGVPVSSPALSSHAVKAFPSSATVSFACQDNSKNRSKTRPTAVGVSGN